MEDESLDKKIKSQISIELNNLLNDKNVMSKVFTIKDE
jgi:hypothetical protein